MATSWVLTKGLDHWRSQINARFPNRDKTSDGTIGDLAHQAESASGHNPDITGAPEYRDGDALNEVRAWDMDNDLRDAYGTDAEELVQWLVRLGRAGTYLPFRYFIYNRRIWRKANNWATQTYTGPSPHTEHVHYSGDYGTAASTEKADSWNGDLGVSKLGIPEDDMPLTDTDVAKIWSYKVDVDVTASDENLQPTGGVLRYTSSEHHAIADSLNIANRAIAGLNGLVTTLTTQVADLQAAVAKLLPAAGK